MTRAIVAVLALYAAFASAAQTTGSFHLCSTLFDKVNPLANTVYYEYARSAQIHVRHQLDHLIGNGMYIKGQSNVFLNRTTTASCTADAVDAPGKPGWQIIKDAPFVEIPNTGIGNDMADYLTLYKKPVYVEYATPVEGANVNATLLFHGWTDPAANYKICAWAVRADDLAIIGLVEKMMYCGTPS